MPTLSLEELTLPFEDLLLPFEEEEDFGADPVPTVDHHPHKHDDTYAVIEDQMSWRPEDG